MLRFTVQKKKAVALEEAHAVELGVSEGYVAAKRFYHAATDSYWVSDLFLVLARRSEEVRVGEVRRSVVERWEGRRTAKVELMSSEMERPTQAHEGRVCAAIEVDFGDVQREKGDLEMLTEWHFYETTLRVFVFRKSKPEEKTEVEIKYRAD